jgi:chromosome segregation ATPase
VNERSKIIDQLDVLDAPPGETITGRILGLHQRLTDAGAGERMQIRKALDVLSAHVGDEGTLTDVARRMVDRLIEALRQRDDQANMRLAAVRSQVAAEDAARLATERADRMDAQWAAAERRAAALEEDAQKLRADVGRLSNQLDYATELCLAGFRQ